MMTENLNLADHLAAVIHAIRTDWDIKGIKTALMNAKDRGTPAEVAHAAIYAAQDPTNRTPAVIPLSGPHWSRGRELTSTGAVPERNDARCERHDWERARGCRACRSEALEVTEQQQHLVSVGIPRDRVRQILAGVTVPDVRMRAAGEREES